MLPWLYHAHHIRYLDDLQFWLGIAQRLGGPLLELGCGTGRLTIPLARAGYPVIGLDNQAGMLGVLMAQLQQEPALKNYISVLQADMTTFFVARQFSLIILACNMLSALSRVERQALLNTVNTHIKPGGFFVASIPNPRSLASLPSHGEEKLEEIFKHPLTSNPVQVSSSWERSTDHLIISWHYDCLEPDGKVQRLTMSISQHLEPVEAYLDEFKRFQLIIDAIYGDFDHSTFQPDSPYLIIIGRK